MPTMLHFAWLLPHAAEREATLFAWGEERQSAPARGAAPPPAVSVLGPLSAPALLRYRLRTLLPAELAPGLRLGQQTLHLPGARRDDAYGTATPHRISGVVLPAVHALSLLSTLSEHDAGRRAQGAPSSLPAASTAGLGQHSLLGVDARFWCQAARCALSLVQAGFVMPVLRYERGALRMHWDAWAGGAADVEFRIQALAALMPTVSLAYAPNAQTDVATLLHHFLQACAGHWMAQKTQGLQRRASGPGRVPAPLVRSAPGALWRRLFLGERIDAAQESPAVLDALLQQWCRWLSRVIAYSRDECPLVVELKAPAAPDAAAGRGGWKLVFSLGAPGQASDCVAAQDVWAQQAQAASAMNVTFSPAHPAVQLLAGLRWASRLWQPCARALAAPRPAELPLSPAEAYEFLDDGRQALAEGGIRARVPAWWAKGTRPELRLLLSLRDPASPVDAPPRPADATEAQAFELEWQVALNGQALTAPQLERLARAQSPLVFMNDQWLQVNEQQIEAARLSLAQSARVRRVSLFQALRLMQNPTAAAEPPDLGLGPGAAGDAPEPWPALPLEMAPLQGRLRDIQQGLQTVTREGNRPEPPGFAGTLRPYQKRGLAWLWFLHRIGLGACLADDMGLGKTVQAIALLLEQERVRPAAVRWPRLLICPTSVLRNWRRELQRFAPGLTAYIHHGPGRADSRTFPAVLARQDLVITSFGIARTDQALLRQVDWHTLIVDEAQNIKNAATQQARAVRSLPGRHRFALTGTPIENSLRELWSILDFLNAGYLDTQAAFVRRYIRPIETRGDEARLRHLQRLVQPFVLRRLKSDPDVVRELPPKQEITVTCELTPEQTALYADMVEAARTRLASLEGIRRKGAILALITQLKKITSHPALLQANDGAVEGRSGKLNRILEMLDEARANCNKALIFTNFVRMGQILQARIRDVLQVEADFLYGRTDLKGRQRMVDRFQAGGPETPILILSLRTGGTGLNLTAANQVYHFDRWWNPAVENQATDRAHRIGQSRRVQVFKYMVAGTIEEHIDNLLRTKSVLAEEILGQGEEWLTELSNERLFELLTLHPGSRAET